MYQAYGYTSITCYYNKRDATDKNVYVKFNGKLFKTSVEWERFAGKRMMLGLGSKMQIWNEVTTGNSIPYVKINDLRYGHCSFKFDY